MGTEYRLAICLVVLEFDVLVTESPLGPARS